MRLDGVLGGSGKQLDAQVLLDPFEEQFDLPALFAKRADGQGRQREIVCQEFERLAGILVEADHAPQSIGIALARLFTRKLIRLKGIRR